jgi:hypothetical protein
MERAVAILNAKRAGLGTLVILPQVGHGLMTSASFADAFRGVRPVYNGPAAQAINAWLRRLWASGN